MGIFNFDKDDDFPSTEEWEKMSIEERIRELTKSIIGVLKDYPEVAYDLEPEIRRIKINKIKNTWVNGVRTMPKRRRRTNLPSSDSSVSPHK